VLRYGVCLGFDILLKRSLVYESLYTFVLKIDRELKVPLFWRSLLHPEPVGPSLFPTNVLTKYTRYELGGVFERQTDGMRMIILIYKQPLSFGKLRRCNTDRGFCVVCLRQLHSLFQSEFPRVRSTASGRRVGSYVFFFVFSSRLYLRQ
jgi:hypothetical protein